MDAPVDVQSAFDLTFNPVLAADHNNLTTLQGGTAGEYYHLTATTEAYIDQDVTSASSPTFTGTNITGVTSVGTIGTGTWEGTDVAFAYVVQAAKGTQTYNSGAGACTVAFGDYSMIVLTIDAVDDEITSWDFSGLDDGECGTVIIINASEAPVAESGLDYERTATGLDDIGEVLVELVVTKYGANYIASAVSIAAPD